MPSLRDLIEVLPECEPKGALRGLATAARVATRKEREHILSRMSAVVRRWRENDPLTRLDEELDRQMEDGRANQP